MNKYLITFILTLISSVTANAGQVILSCDFKGTDGVNDVEIKREVQGLVVNVQMLNQELAYYSLPIDSETTPTAVDLSRFAVFKDIPRPTLKNIFGYWYYLVDERSAQLMSCAWLR